MHMRVYQSVTASGNALTLRRRQKQPNRHLYYQVLHYQPAMYLD